MLRHDPKTVPFYAHGPLGPLEKGATEHRQLSLPAAASLLLGVLASCSESVPSGPSPVHFVDGTAAAGITFHHDNGKSDDLFMIESLTAGGIFFDADQDGDQDLYFLNGHRLKEPIGDSTATNTFYSNDGTGHFTDASSSTGLDDPRYANGVSGADYDNDGDIDLYVTNFEVPNALFRNDGTGHFEDVAASAGVEGTHSSDASSAFVDLDNDGWLELYVCNYNDHTIDFNHLCQMYKRDGSGLASRYCSVERYDPVPDTLYRNLGDGTFEDISAVTGVGTTLGRSFAVAFADYDHDGDQDAFVACDRSPNLYFENLGGMEFREIADDARVALDKNGKARAGMGIISGDIDGDGDLDAAVTYFEREYNGFYENRGGNRFRGVEERNGTGRASNNYVGWGIELFDADLDTDLDCLVVNGHFIDNAHLFREPIANYEQPNLFYLNRGDGNFDFLGERAGPALTLEEVGRGLAVADIDNDGDLDAMVFNLGRPPHLLRNDSPRAGRHWLMVRTVGTTSNRDGIGARIEVHLADKTLIREVHTGQTYLSQSDLRQHFGLGETASVPRVEVHWPSGKKSVLVDVEADRVVEIVEPRE